MVKVLKTVMPSTSESDGSRWRRFRLCAFVIGLVFSQAALHAQEKPASTARTFVPSPLRVAINYGNAVLAQRDRTTGDLSGVSVDVARELGRRLGVDISLVGVDAADKSVEAVRQGAADVGFFAIDPQRGQGLRFTPPYVVIEGAYGVPATSPIQTPDDVDRPGIRVVVAEKSAYDLYLSRALGHAQLVKTTRSNEVVDLMFAGNFEVAAGVKQQLEKDVQTHPGFRILQPSFMQIRQAMATSASRTELNDYLREFIESLKASGFIQQSLLRHRIEGVTVAPSMPTH